MKRHVARSPELLGDGLVALPHGGSQFVRIPDDRLGEELLILRRHLVPGCLVDRHLVQGQRVEARIDRILGDLVEAHRIVGRERGGVGGADHTLVQRGEDLRLRQVNRRSAGGSERGLNHALGGTDLHALQVLDAVDRYLGRDRLRRLRRRADELHAIGVEDLVVELGAAAVVEEGAEFLGARVGADRVADQREGRIFASEVGAVGDVPAEDAGAHGVKRLVVLDDRADWQHLDFDPAVRHLADMRCPVLLDLEGGGSRVVARLELQVVAVLGPSGRGRGQRRHR